MTTVEIECEVVEDRTDTVIVRLLTGFGNPEVTIAKERLIK